uniref:Uncharacterized protein n=1 Tax=Tetranychus urticae TaxID=32264 RepID=T1L2Y0_TETUR
MSLAMVNIKRKANCNPKRTRYLTIFTVKMIPFNLFKFR